MKTRMLGLTCAVLSAIALDITIASIGSAIGQQSRGASNLQNGEYTISAPYVYKNLAIFLIQGKNKVTGKTFLTLQEALEGNKAIVYETQNVNELAIENLSYDEDVYVQSGEIVKGGQQDRMLGADLIVPPRSGKMQIAAFCVEHGRWTKRGDEASGNFNTSSASVATRELKLAAKRENSQGEVWQRVTEAQDKLSRNVGGSVRSEQSASSFQLTLENKKVQQTAESYISKLSGIIDGKSDVIGYAFAINGQVNSADVYVSSELFKKLWPKLLKASAIEAIADLQEGQRSQPPSTDAVKAFMAQSEGGAASEKDVTSRIRLVMRETNENILFETRDAAKKGGWIHRNYIRK